MDKLFIWGDYTPFNSSRSKLKDMEIHMEYTEEDTYRL